jgi:hypothetical protein
MTKMMSFYLNETVYQNGVVLVENDIVLVNAQSKNYKAKRRVV